MRDGKPMDRRSSEGRLGKNEIKPGRSRICWTDSAYSGKLLKWARAFGGWTVEVVRKKEGQKGFRIVPRSRVVERTFAWIGRCRRLAKEYEALSASSECWIHLP